MPRIVDLPDVIPLFPLPGALLLPRARLPLHLFEPRYLAMLDDCLKTPERLIGMVQPREARDGALQSIGCAGRLTGFSETEDGRYMITLTGISRFRLKRQIDGFSAISAPTSRGTGSNGTEAPPKPTPPSTARHSSACWRATSTRTTCRPTGTAWTRPKMSC